MALLLAAIAVSLVVASALHLSGQVHGRGAPFDAEHAGVAEALIAVVLAAARDRPVAQRIRARQLGLWATGFAILGFCGGLTSPHVVGDWPDIGYHLTVLPLLVTGFAALLRGRRVASEP